MKGGGFDDCTGGVVVLTFLWHGMVRMEQRLHERSCPGRNNACLCTTAAEGVEIEGSRHELTKIYRRAKYYWVGTSKTEVFVA